MEKIRVVLLDDHMFVRQGVRTILEETDDIVVVQEAENAKDGLAAIEQFKPDVLVLDLQMEDVSGAEVCWQVAQISPQTAVLILSAFLNPQLLQTCLSAGARGYLLKDAKGLDIASAVRVLFHKGTVFDERVNELSQELMGTSKSLFEALSPRELQTLTLLCRGLTNQEIADELCVSLNTIKGYIKEIMRKMECRNRVEVVIKAREFNLI